MASMYDRELVRDILSQMIKTDNHSIVENVFLQTELPKKQNSKTGRFIFRFFQNRRTEAEQKKSFIPSRHLVGRGYIRANSLPLVQNP